MSLVQIVSGKMEGIRHKYRLLKVKYPAIIETLRFLVFSFIIIIIISGGIKNLNYRWQWYRVSDFIYSFSDEGFIPGPLLTGLGMTISISAISFVLSFIFGFTAALFRLSDSATANLTAIVYLETTRNTPLLIQLFLVYFVVSPILGIGRITSAVLALSLFEGSYTSEIIRSGIIAIDKGQWEAAHSIGLNKVQTYVRIILPQALRNILPILSSQTISLVKDSALVSTIAIYELTMQGQVAISETFLTFEIWFTIAAIYLAINICLSFISQRIEAKFKKAGA